MTNQKNGTNKKATQKLKDKKQTLIMSLSVILLIFMGPAKCCSCSCCCCCWCCICRNGSGSGSGSGRGSGCGCGRGSWHWLGNGVGSAITAQCSNSSNRCHHWQWLRLWRQLRTRTETMRDVGYCCALLEDHTSSHGQEPDKSRLQRCLGRSYKSCVENVLPDPL